MSSISNYITDNVMELRSIILALSYYSRLSQASRPCAAGILEAMHHFGNSPTSVTSGGMTQEEASGVNRLCETAKRLWGALHASLICAPADQISPETDRIKDFEGMYVCLICYFIRRTKHLFECHPFHEHMHFGSIYIS